MAQEYSSERTSYEYITVNSCNIEYIYDKDRGSLREKGRVDYHIIYVKKGTCYVTLDGAVKAVPEGGIIMFRPNERQEYFYKSADKSISHYIHFTGIGCERILKQLNIYDIRVFNMGVSRTYEEISEKMVREFTMKNYAYEQYCSALLLQLLTVISRKYVLRYNNISRLSEKRINSACRIIYDNPGRNLTAEELAGKCCISVSRFTHLFKEVTGKSLKEYTTSLRIEKAKEMLTNSDAPICEIASAVGYEDQNYFSRVFKNETGMSPTLYRKNFRFDYP